MKGQVRLSCARAHTASIERGLDILATFRAIYQRVRERMSFQVFRDRVILGLDSPVKEFDIIGGVNVPRLAKPNEFVELLLGSLHSLEP